jgi:CheY-like chemotaxis protein
MEMPIRVLIVEDQERYQKLFREIVGNLAETVDVAADLDEAVEMLDRTLYHLALVDYRLDDVDPRNRDGKIVAMHIEDLRESTQVIVLTAYGELEDAIEALRDFHVRTFFRKQKMELVQVREEIQRALKENEDEILLTRRLEPRGFPSSLLGTSYSELPGELSVDGTLQDFESFLKGLFDGLYPLLTASAGPQAPEVEPGSQVVRSRFWSKALSEPTEVGFGERHKVAAMTEELEKTPEMMQAAGLERKVKELLDETSRWGGVVYILADKAFDDFRPAR